MEDTWERRVIEEVRGQGYGQDEAAIKAGNTRVGGGIKRWDRLVTWRNRLAES